MNSNYVAEIQSTYIPNEQLVVGQHVSVNIYVSAVASPEFSLRRDAAVFLWYCILQAFLGEGSRCPFSIKIGLLSLVILLINY